MFFEKLDFHGKPQSRDARASFVCWVQEIWWYPELESMELKYWESFAESKYSSNEGAGHPDNGIKWF